MGYRTSARDASESTPEVKGDSLTRVEVSGRAGLPGAPGRHGAHGSGSGSDGRPGGNAGAAESGQDAGVIHTVLTPDAADSENVSVGGKYTTADGDRKRLSRTVAIGDAGFIDLVARGGTGGRAAMAERAAMARAARAEAMPRVIRVAETAGLEAMAATAAMVRAVPMAARGAQSLWKSQRKTRIY